jgi:hypothetical protein
MSLPKRILRRLLPLYVGALVASFAPHACWGLRTGGYAPTIAHIAILIPAVMGCYFATAMRRWWGVVIGFVCFGFSAAGFTYNAGETGGYHLSVHTEELAFMVIAASIVYLIAATRACVDRSWLWRDAVKSLLPSWHILGFLVWAGAVWLIGCLLTYWPEFRHDPYEKISWTVLHVAVSAIVFQFAVKSCNSFLLRAALSYAAAFLSLGFMEAYVDSRVIDPSSGSWALVSLSLLGFAFFLAQDELARQDRGPGLLARQRLFVTKRALVIAGVCAGVLLFLGLPCVIDGNPFVVLAAAVASLWVLHAWLLARLKVLLVSKLLLNCVAVFGVLDFAGTVSVKGYPSGGFGGIGGAIAIILLMVLVAVVSGILIGVFHFKLAHTAGA